MNQLVVSHAGVRGRPDLELDPNLIAELVARFAAFAQMQGLPPVIALAHDERSSSPALAQAAAAAAVQAGLDVIELGAVSTPAAKLFYARRGLAGAVIVTGSHLDPELNGVKLVSGTPPCPVDPRSLPEPVRPERVGKRTRDSSAAVGHRDVLLAHSDAEAIASAGIAASCSGGVGDSGERLLSALGMRPGDELELSLDADGDRLALAGVATDAVLLVCAAAADPRHLVKGADTSRAIDLLMPGRVTTVAPGELHLFAGMADTGAGLAGEGNGGVVRADIGSGRDGLGAAVLLLELLARANTSLSELLAELPAIAVRRATLPGADARARAAMLPGAIDLGAERGVELELPDRAWALVRESATEPLTRITVEASTGGEADALLAELLARLNG